MLNHARIQVIRHARGATSHFDQGDGVSKIIQAQLRIVVTVQRFEVQSIDSRGHVLGIFQSAKLLRIVKIY